MTTTTVQQYNLLMNGQIVPGAAGRYFDSVNPSNGEVFARVADASVDDMLKAIDAARDAFDNGSWSGLCVADRGSFLKRIADGIRKNAKGLAELETLDVGKMTKQSTLVDVPTCADTFEYFACVQNPLAPEKNSVAAPVDSQTLREPIGVVGCIIPWNYPLIMSAWKMAPALIAGNTVVFKPSQQASVSVMKLAQIIQEAGLPQGVVNIAPSTDHSAAEALVKSDAVNMISFTGGTETGRKIMQLAADHTKKLSLELGGKSPTIVLEDCDVDAAVGGVMSSIFMNQGQMCTAGSRLLLDEKIYDQFLPKLIERAKGLKIGPATSYDANFGPVVSRQHRDSILKFIEKGKKEGATLVCGGEIPDGAELEKGFYIEPTIFTDVSSAMTIAQEEIFGPVLSVIRFANIEDAIDIANDTRFGLAAGIWTKDKKKARKIAEQLQSGIVWINTYGGFYNEASFGGYKESGFGRELGKDGLNTYTQTKHVCIDETPGGTPLAASWF